MYKISKQRKVLSITFRNLSVLTKHDLLCKEIAGMHLNCGTVAAILLCDQVSSV